MTSDVRISRTQILLKLLHINFRFNSLENEVRKRDEIISQLQKRIQELEKLGLSGMSPTAQPTGEVPSMPEVTEAVQPTSTSQPISKSASSGSEDASAAEEGFMVRAFCFSFR